jgi:hypothetical protein
MQSESIRRQVKAVWAILAMLTFWITIHTVKLNTIVPDFNSINKTINVLLDRVNSIEETAKSLQQIKGELEYEKIYNSPEKRVSPFDTKFSEMRYMYGPGAIFSWNGSEYTTYYKEELTSN